MKPGTTSDVKLPVELELRRELNDEVHARPPERLAAPTGIISRS